MPQKGYIGNKKALPKKKNVETPEIPSDEDVEMETKAESVAKTVTKDTFSLYVRGAAWIKDRDNAENRLKDICPKIKSVRHPRQKSADYCFIDFANAADRDQCLEELKDNPEVNVKPVTKDVPKLFDKRKKQIQEKREAKKETRKLLAKIEKNNKKNVEKVVERTNQLIISNLPAQATTADIKEQFPKSVKIDLRLKNKKHKLNSAIITFPEPSEAAYASKQQHVLHGQKLNVFLNNSTAFKQQLKNKRKSVQKDSNGQPEKKTVKTD